MPSKRPLSANEYAPKDLLGPFNEVERKNAPSRLFAQGDLSLLESGARVSVVGSRKASPKGLSEARALSEWLARQSIIVVSGLAEGVDTAAHEATIAAGGRTIAVLGTSLTEYFPATNRALQETIIRYHLALSQFPPGVPASRGNFPIRNRTMALITDATIIVEAGDGSGSLHQAWEALRLGRPLFVIDHQLADESMKWTRELAHYGAQPLSLDAVEILFDYLPERTRGKASELAF